MLAGGALDGTERRVAGGGREERVADGERLKDAVAVVAQAAGVPKRELYAAALAEQRD